MTDTSLASLLELIRSWFTDDDLREQHNNDLEAYLDSEGHGDISAGEAYDLVTLCLDDVQVQSGDFSRNYDTAARSNAGNVSVEAPPPPKHDGDWESVNNYTEYVVNTYNFTEITDQSVNTQIQADGDVEFDQEVDNVSADDGGVALGEDADIEDSNVVTGDGNMTAGDDIEDSQNIGGDNSGIAANDDSTVTTEDTAFGGGDVSSDDDTTTVQNSENVNVASGEGDADQDVDQSTDIDTDVDIDDSFNTDNSTEFEDSFNTDVDQDIDIEEDGPGDVDDVEQDALDI